MAGRLPSSASELHRRRALVESREWPSAANRETGAGRRRCVSGKAWLVLGLVRRVAHVDRGAGRIQVVVGDRGPGDDPALWTPGIVDGLLQTEDYARALISVQPSHHRRGYASGLANRMERQRRVMARRDPAVSVVRH